MFVTSQGDPRAEFIRAVERGDLLQAKALVRAAAADPGTLSLGDALSPLYLLVAKRDRKPAALRWTARFLLEVPAVTVEETQLAPAALYRPDRDGTAQEALTALCRRHTLRPPKLAAA